MYQNSINMVLQWLKPYVEFHLKKEQKEKKMMTRMEKGCKN